MSKGQQKIAYFFGLITSTPHWGSLFCLQVLSGLASFLGLPLLMPVLELMQGSNMSAQASGYVKLFMPLLTSLGMSLNMNTMLCLAAVLILAGQLLVNISSLLVTYVKEDLLAAYRKRIFNAYAAVDWPWLSDHHSARMYHAVVKEAEGACDAHMNAQRVLINLFQIGIYFLISLRLSWQVTLMAVGIYFIVGVLNMFNSSRVNALSEDINQQFKHFSNDTVSFQHNKKFIKVALLGRRFLDAFAGMIDHMRFLRKRQMLHVEMQRAWNVMSTSILLIALICFHQTLNLNYASLLLILFVFMRLAPQFVALSDVYSALDMSIPMHQSLQNHLQALSIHQERNGPAAFEVGAAIRFEQVDFAYPQQPLVLNKLNLTIKPQQMTAFVGKSGSGKSTVLDLLLGLLPPKDGIIRYGDIPHDKLDKESLRRCIAFVGQRPSLLDGTLRENLAVARPQATDAEILSVCRQVHLEEFVRQLPQGLAAVVGENGIKLSGGQRQRIALARCLLANPAILILDEATSELDSESEAVIQQTLRQLRGRMTIIMVAHRLSTVKAADTIYVIDAGVACEAGTYDELIARKGRFYELVSLQGV